MPRPSAIKALAENSATAGTALALSVHFLALVGKLLERIDEQSEKIVGIYVECLQRFRGSRINFEGKKGALNLKLDGNGEN